MSIPDILALINQGGVMPFMLIIIVGSLRGWWIPRYMFDDMREDRDAWKSLALSGTEMAERLTKVVPSPRKRSPRTP